MTLGNIAKRYAKALYLYATECKAEESVYEQALALCHTLAEVPELSRTLNNPVLGQSAKQELLNQSVGGEMVLPLRQFMRLVFKQHRECHLLFILHSYVAFYRKQKHVYVGKLTTAVPMDTRVEELLRHKITQTVQGSVEFDIRVDEKLLGGFILQLDDQRMDASVRGQLQRIKKEWIS